MRITDNYVFFWGGPFSQWHKCQFHDGNTDFNCAEQYMMYQKAVIFGDYTTAQKILKAGNPSIQKKYGREVEGFSSKKWNECREAIVYEGNLLKFKQNPELKRFLLTTGQKTLVEASPYDTIWGVGLGENDPRIPDPNYWKGLNLLGIALMKVREALK